MNGGKGSDFEFSDGRIIRLKNEDEKDELTVSSDTESRRVLESYRETRARKTAIKRTAAVCIVLAVFLILSAVAVFIFFRINDVVISGSERYGEEELYSALGLSKGSNLILTSSKTLENRLRKAFPALDKITVKKQLPDKLVITVTDGVGEYFLKTGGDVYILDKSLRILEISEKIPDDLPELISCDIQSAVLGEMLTFRTETHYNYLTRLLSDIRDHKAAPHINRIDMSEKFGVKLKYDDRFIISIGDAENASVKLTLAEEIIATLAENDKGIIDATDIEKCTFRKMKEID